MEDFLCLRNSSTELQILVDSPTWFEVLKNVGCINPKTILHRLGSKTISALKLWYIGFLPGRSVQKSIVQCTLLYQNDS